MFKEKIEALTKAYNEKISKRSALLEKADKVADSEDLEGLKEIRSNLSSLKDEINSSKSEIDELNELAKEAAETRSVLTIPTDAKKAQAKPEYRDLLNSYFHKKEVRSGLISDNAEVTIPDVTQYIPEHEVKSVVDLSQFVNVFAATGPSGKYPIVKRATAVLNTVEELQKNPELAKPDFITIPWEVATYRGAIAISKEAIDDSRADLTGIVAQNALEQKVNTTNAKVAEVLEGFTAKTVSGDDVDAIKEILNVDLDPAYSPVIIASQSFYQYLDTIKDKNGRYLLNDPIVSSSPATLLGVPVYKVGDELLGKAGEAHAFIGDPRRAVLYANRTDVQVRWVDNDIYGQYLQAVIRFGVSKADEKAGFFVTEGAAVAGTTGE